jgi:hypothetical protein
MYINFLGISTWKIFFLIHVFRPVLYVSLVETEEINKAYTDSMSVCLPAQSKPTENLILVNICEARP